MEISELLELLAPSEDMLIPDGLGRGIVICAGGSRLLTNAYVLVRSLREVLGCTENIEIWHVGASEMPPPMARIFRDLGCVMVDANFFISPEDASLRDGWHLKLHALSYTRFAEVLLLDADQVPVANPACVFEWDEFKETGALFWPDILDFVPDNPIWQRLGMEPRDITSIETGQLCVDRGRHSRAITVARQMLEHQDLIDCDFYGDKDAILLAWLKLQSSYTLVPHAPFRDQRYLGQRHMDGSLLFQHRTGCKFTLHETPYFPDAFVGTAECQGFLESLRSIWNESSFQSPARSIAARTAEQTLLSQQSFEFKLGDYAPTIIVFLEGNQIGLGRQHLVQNWHIEETDTGCLILVLHSRTRRTYEFEPTDGNSWSGKSLTIVETSAVLSPKDGLLSSPLVGLPPRGLADELLDGALAQAYVGAFDLGGFQSALRFINTLEPKSHARLAERVQVLEKSVPEVAKALRAVLAEAESGATNQEIKEVRINHGMLSNSAKYRRH